MNRSERLPVFLAHSFDERPPDWSSVADTQVALFFETLLKSLKWQVLSGKKPQARPIGEKVSESVNQSKAVVAVFTGRDKLASGELLPSPWVLCECAYALGRFEGSRYLVAGFREKGIHPDRLAMLTVGGMEFPEFERGNLTRDKPKFIEHLRDLEKRIRRGAPLQSLREAIEALRPGSQSSSVLLPRPAANGAIQHFLHTFVAPLLPAPDLYQRAVESPPPVHTRHLVRNPRGLTTCR